MSKEHESYQSILFFSISLGFFISFNRILFGKLKKINSKSKSPNLFFHILLPLSLIIHSKKQSTIPHSQSNIYANCDSSYNTHFQEHKHDSCTKMENSQKLMAS